MQFRFVIAACVLTFIAIETPIAAQDLSSNVMAFNAAATIKKPGDKKSDGTQVELTNRFPKKAGNVARIKLNEPPAKSLSMPVDKNLQTGVRAASHAVDGEDDLLPGSILQTQLQQSASDPPVSSSIVYPEQATLQSNATNQLAVAEGKARSLPLQESIDPGPSLSNPNTGGLPKAKNSSLSAAPPLPSNTTSARPMINESMVSGPAPIPFRNSQPPLQYLPYSPEYQQQIPNYNASQPMTMASAGVPPSNQYLGEYQTVVGGDAPDYGGSGGNQQFYCTDLFYLSVFAGNNSVGDFKSRQPDVIQDFGGFQMKDGVVVGMNLGIYQGRNLRTECELAYRTNAVDFATDPVALQFPQNFTGDLKVFSGMSNAYWDFVDCSLGRFNPYVGAGIGFAHFSSDINSFGRPAFQNDYDTDSSFAYQWMIGANGRLTDDIDLYIEYRRFDSGDVDLLRTFTFDPAAIYAYGPPGRYDYSSNNVILGLRIRF